MLTYTTAPPVSVRGLPLCGCMAKHRRPQIEKKFDVRRCLPSKIPYGYWEVTQRLIIDLFPHHHALRALAADRIISRSPGSPPEQSLAFTFRVAIAPALRRAMDVGSHPVASSGAASRHRVPGVPRAVSRENRWDLNRRRDYRPRTHPASSSS